MNRFARMYWMMQAVGWENVPRRAWHIAKGRLRLDRADRLKQAAEPAQLAAEFLPSYRPESALEEWRARSARFFTGPQQLVAMRGALGQVVDDARWEQQVARPVAELSQGQMRLFHHRAADVGWPVEFNRDPLHGLAWPVGQARRTYQQFDPRFNDLKCVWEASRFQTAFLLARDVARRPESPGGSLFWQLLETWDRQNAFAASPQWVCGQEATFRLMAWLFAACLLVDEPDADAARYHRLTELVYLTGRLIEENLIYARSQKNNHAISEATGLWTLGLMFPELRRATAWRARGRRVLCEELARQIYADGSYVQHSTNYHRVMMDDVVWAIRLGALHGDPLGETHAPLSRALDWLLAMIEPESGRVPNYGANDGALVLPLTTCDYTDFRPIAQATHYTLRGSRAYPPGPWDEQMLWLCGAESVAGKESAAGAARSSEQPARKPAQWQAPQGGYYTTAGPKSWLFTRVHGYHDRPNHADMLHVDLWYGRTNLLRDGGTFHYFSQPPWQHFFESTAGHNTIELDGQDQMDRGPNFLWFRWTQAKLIDYAFSLDGRAACIVGEHYGYRRLPGKVVHRRTIARLLDTYVIVDDLSGTGTHDVALRWRLHPGNWAASGARWNANVEGQAFSIEVSAPAEMKARLCCGEVEPEAEGWESLYYANREPVPTLVTRGRVSVPMRLVTIVGPSDAMLEVRSAGNTVAGTPEPNAAVRIAGLRDASLADEIARLSRGVIVGA